MDLPRSADCIIVGGGVVGCSIACALAERGVDVFLLEARALLGVGSTSASVGGVRQQYAEAHNIGLVQASLRELDEFEGRYDYPLSFVRNGYLLLAASGASQAQLERDVVVQHACGVPSRILDAGEICELVPGLIVDDVVCASYCAEDGWLDPSALLNGYAAGARRAGARLLVQTPVLGIEQQREGLWAVRTSRGRLGTRTLVLAAGPMLGPLARLADVSLHLQPTRRQVFVTRPTPVLPSRVPLTVDLDSPCYFRPESGGVLFSGAEESPVEAEETPQVDWQTLESVTERVVRRFPRLAEARVLRGWSGVRTLTPDRTALLGPIRDRPGLYVAGGFSGHGVMQSPAVGRIMADLICDGRASHVDLAPFAPDRFLDEGRWEKPRAI